MMEEQLHKWLNDDLSAEETAKLQEEDHSFQEMTQLSKAGECLRLPTFDLEKSWQQLKKRKLTEQKSMNKQPNIAWRRWIGVAAAAVLALLLAFQFGLFNTASTFETLARKKDTFTFPDGSSVILNAGSKIYYNQKTFNEKRIVKLEGEGEFFVKKGSGFLVKTDYGLVRVLGTTFNVYARKDGFEVNCYLGKVEARKEDQIVTLSMNEEAIWNEETNSLEKRGNPYEAPLWIRNETAYQNAPYSRVIKELERQYGIKVKLDIKGEPRYTGGIPHDDLQSAMDNIVEPYGYRYLQDGGNMRIWEE